MNNSGIVPVFKPKGMTSHDVVARIRKILGTKKVGHTGTLDPQVQGVLPVLVGRATRLSDYFMKAPKRYRATALLGYSTDTQDAEGNIVEYGNVNPSSILEEDLLKALMAFRGEIKQLPPDYSAVKIGGKKLLDYVREGKEVPVKKARTVQIYDLSLLDYVPPRVTFDILCSKGTYVRTLCADLGDLLATKAHMEHLVRTSSGGFVLEEAVSLESISEESLLSMSEAVLRLPVERVVLPREERLLWKVTNGIKFDIREEALRDHPYSNWTKAEGKKRFVYVDNVFYGIADEYFRLEKLIVDK